MKIYGFIYFYSILFRFNFTAVPVGDVHRLQNTLYAGSLRAVWAIILLPPFWRKQPKKEAWFFVVPFAGKPPPNSIRCGSLPMLTNKLQSFKIYILLQSYIGLINV